MMEDNLQVEKSDRVNLEKQIKELMKEKVKL